MEEKVFDLLEKMYADLSGKIDGMSKEMQELKGNMAAKQDIVRLENRMDTKHKALFDVYKQTYEKLTALEIKFDEIDKKVEKQDVEIRVIKGVK